MWAVIRDPCNESAASSNPATSYSQARGRWVLAATIVASSMTFIDGTVVNVALPALQKEFNATVVDVQWVVEAYSLLLSALLLVGGSLGDHYGRRRIFLLGVGLFTAASGVCGLAANMRQLIAARAFQGLGAALLVPGSLAIISTSFPEKERGRAIGTWSSFSAITAGIGPVLGGWLIEHVSWRVVFFLNLPLAVFVTLIARRYISESIDKQSTRVDWLGALLVALGLGALVYGLIESAPRGFDHPLVLVVLSTAGVLLSFFLVFEARISQPMLPLHLFRSPTFTGANLLTFFLYAALGGTLFFLPLNLIQVQHYSATAAGSALLPFILIMSFLSRWSGGLVASHGAKLPLVIGPLIAASGFALFTLPGIGGSYWTTYFPPTALLGFGMAISVAPLTTTVMNSVQQNHVGLASGVNNALARTAGLLAIAVLGIVMLHVFNRSLERRVTEWKLPESVRHSLQAQPARLAGITLAENQSREIQELTRRAVEESFVDAFRVVMGIGAGLAILSGLTAITLIRRNPDSVSPDRHII